MNLWRSLLVLGGLLALAACGSIEAPPTQVVATQTAPPTSAAVPPSPTVSRVGTAVPTLMTQHIQAGARASYNSDPPTSGDHYGTPARWGVHGVAPMDEALVHNLEHGGVVIYHRPGRLTGAELSALEQQLGELALINQRVVLAPRAQLDSALVLTAWGYLQKLDTYDPAAVRAFFDSHIARGPECVQGQCP